MLHDRWTITELAGEFGVSLRTLRFYESVGLLKPDRIGTARLYSGKDRVRLELIVKGKRLGFSLAEIQQLLADGPRPPGPSRDRDREIIGRLSPHQIDTQIGLLERQRLQLRYALDELQTILKSVDQAPSEDSPRPLSLAQPSPP